MKTRITQLLDIQYPILAGGMQWVSRAPLVAAVAEAGGTGFLTAASFGTPENLRTEIEIARTLTGKPFGVNISMLPEADVNEASMAFVDVVIQTGIPFVETAGRSPAHMVPRLKEAGVKILHKVTVPRHAVKAQKDGVDAVILVGYEGAGHPGMAQVGTFVDLPAAVDAVDIPVIAAGGICDGKSMAAALSLGADGVLMGTRWIATKECGVHENLKQWIVNAHITDTIIIQRSIKNAMRSINNRKAREVLGLEQLGADLTMLLPHISGKLGERALENGDLESAVLTMGQSAGRIEEIIPVRAVIDSMVQEFQQTVSRMEYLAGCAESKG